MTIAFFHNGKSFLPEIEAYSEYFKKRNIQCIVVHPHQKSSVDFDVEWHFMGTGKRRKKQSILIHEYGSLSTPPFAVLKNFFKKNFNVKPDFRIFLNEVVKRTMHFKDNIPCGIRDMGVDLGWETKIPTEKKNDFIYIGSTAKNRGLEILLQVFADGQMKDSTLLILSKDYEFLQKKYASYPNITFLGPLKKHEVLMHIQSSKYGLNYIPDIFPFNIQTSTKFLEYCLAGTPVITSDYAWIRSFEKKFGGRFYYLKDDLSNLDVDSIQHFPFQFPDLKEWSWEYQIEKSGILDFLYSKF